MTGIKIIFSLEEIKKTASALQSSSRSCGLVPTLGALHPGHVSLIKKARKENDIVIVSVFVNPLQFRKSVYRKYPRNLERDVDMAEKAGADILFAPETEAMYHEDFSAEVILPNLFRVLKHQKLEWHYRGVLVVVMKLFNLIRPSRAYFGLKDPRQLALIEKMVEDFNIPVEIVTCPTIRERNGFAMSSRNALLTPEERRTAPVIYRSLLFAKEKIEREGIKAIPSAISGIRKMLKENRLLRPEHVEIVDAKSLGPVTPDSREALVSAVVWIGDKRLTDNIRFRLKRD